MYNEFFGLTEKPFSILPDPDYLYWGHNHSLAFSMLEYGILNQAGFTVITGEVGCGKTTLIRHLLNNMSEELNVGLISNVQDDKGDLLQWVLLAFDQPFDEVSAVKLFDQFQKYLIAEYGRGRRTVLIVDEAQNLGTKTLEQLRMLSNINADKHQLLQLILVGQPQLKDLLQRPELVQFSQRISSDFYLKPFNLEEVAAYIEHRLKVAGCEEKLFSDEACTYIYMASRGIPRLINIICDTALTYAFSEDTKKISKELIEKVIADKGRHGIIHYSEVNETKANRLYEIPDSSDGPALIIHDQNLAKYLLKKAKQ